MTDSEAPAADAAATAGGPVDDDAYGGLFGAFPYAFRRTESRLCKLYVAVAGLLGGLLVLFFGLAFVVQVFNTLSGTGGTFTFSRALFILVGLLVVGPVLAPVLLVARRHRRTGSDARYDRLVAAAGVGFLLSLYLGVVASIPPEFVLDGETVTRTPPSGLLAPLVEALYAIPSAASPLIPLTAALAIYGVHRYAR
jgi:predicted neutral ceramidase superfamily lipid hydrolase